MTQLDASSSAGSAVVQARPVETDEAAERGALHWALLSLAIGAVSLLAVWAISPRFEIDVPSLVDDWAAYFYSPDQIGDVLRFANPEVERFRPGVVVWGYLQWHTLGAPESLFGPNAWNVLRIVILVAGLTLFTALALPVRRGRLELLLYVGLASIPAFVVVLIPKFARDLARFGPQEPLLVGGMALGGSLLVLAARPLLDPTSRVRTWAVAALAVAGTLAWLLGTYQKEASICVLPLLAGVAYAGRSRRAIWKSLSTARRVALGALGAVVVLPLLHVAIETIRIVQRGDLVYEAEANRDSAVAGVQVLWDWTHEAVPENARYLAYGAVVLAIVATVLRRRLDPIAVGALASGALTFVYAGQSGVVATRYYIPAVALFAVAFSLSLARLPAPLIAAGGLAVFFSFMPPPGTRDDVQLWTSEEVRNGALVREAAELESSGCVVAAAGLFAEETVALPVVMGTTRTGGSRSCSPGETFLVVGPGPEGTALAAACRRGGLTAMAESPVGKVYRCAALRDSPAAARIVTRNRLEPVVLD